MNPSPVGLKWLEYGRAYCVEWNQDFFPPPELREEVIADLERQANAIGIQLLIIPPFLHLVTEPARKETCHEP